MSHLRLVPPLPQPRTAPAAETDVQATMGTAWAGAGVPAQRTPYDDPKVALLFFQAASGLCLCRACAKQRHPAYGAR
jgi:hypothetical protein